MNRIELAATINSDENPIVIKDSNALTQAKTELSCEKSQMHR